jgi:hypothetical protein
MLSYSWLAKLSGSICTRYFWTIHNALIEGRTFTSRSRWKVRKGISDSVAVEHTLKLGQRLHSEIPEHELTRAVAFRRCLDGGHARIPDH